MENSYHIKIKKEYASAIIEDLQLVNAIEIVGEIPLWQQEEVAKRLQKMKENPSSTLSEEDIFGL